VSASLAIANEHELVRPPYVRPANDEKVTTEAVLDVEDVARLLRVGRNTVYELVGRNEIPNRRLGRACPVIPAVLDEKVDRGDRQVDPNP